MVARDFSPWKGASELLLRPEGERNFSLLARQLHVSLRAAVRCLGALAIATITGCTSIPKPIFSPHKDPLLWPAPPAPARIEYIGQIRTSADLNAPRSAAQSLGDLFVGKKEPDSLYGPRDVLVTPGSQHVWVADPGGRCLHLFDLVRREYHRILRMADEPLLAPVALTNGPDGSVFLCDSERVAIYLFDNRDGRLIRSLRLPDELRRPVSATFLAVTDTLFVVDAAAHDIKVLSPDGDLIRILGRRGTAPGEFNFPTAITTDGELLWIADTGNYRVQAITFEGEAVKSFGQPGDAPGDLAMPKALALDPDGHLYVVDSRFENVQVFDRDGRLLMYFGEEGVAPGQFWLPGGMFIEPGGRIWICDTYNRRVQVFQYLGSERRD
jgi:sugar lactone lactonase YvrE